MGLSLIIDQKAHLCGDDASRRVTDFDPGGVHLESNDGLSSVGERIVKDEFDGGAVGRQADQRRLRQTVLILVNGINVEPQRIWKTSTSGFIRNGLREVSVTG